MPKEPRIKFSLFSFKAFVLFTLPCFLFTFLFRNDLELPDVHFFYSALGDGGNCKMISLAPNLISGRLLLKTYLRSVSWKSGHMGNCAKALKPF